VIATVAVVLALLAGCSGSSGDPRADAVEGTVELIVVPRYDAAAEAIETLRADVAALCAAPSPTTLAAARTSWHRARIAWSETEAAWVGPVMDRRSEGLVDWPASGDRVDAVIAGADGAIGPDAVRATATSARGLGALEYLLFADGEDTAGRLRAEPRRCAYAEAVAAVAAEESAAVLRAWTDGVDGEPAYEATLTGAGEDAIDGEEAVGMLVERHLFLVERISDAEIGASLGMRGTPLPEALAEGPAGAGGEDVVARLEGVRAEYEPGGEGDSATLGDLLRERDPDVHERLVATLDAAIAKARAVDGPLGDHAAGRRAVREAIKHAQTVLETEVVSVLGVTVGFSDNDGDSG
jgi:predicted lipoprotein